MQIDVEFKSGDASTPGEIVQFIMDIIPTAELVMHLETQAISFVESAESEIGKPIVWNHKARLVIPK